jgi:hypothetical protein
MNNHAKACRQGTLQSSQLQVHTHTHTHKQCTMVRNLSLSISPTHTCSNERAGGEAFCCCCGCWGCCCCWGGARPACCCGGGAAPGAPATARSRVTTTCKNNVMCHNLFFCVCHVQESCVCVYVVYGTTAKIMCYNLFFFCVCHVQESYVCVPVV